MATLLARAGLPVADRVLAGRISTSALLGAETAFQRGDRPAARQLLDIVVASRPRSAGCLARAAHLSNALGEVDTAKRLCAKALQREPLNHEAMLAQAHLDLPGPNYLDVLRRIHLTLRPRTYLEIGIAKGKSMRLIAPGTRAVGIDPQPTIEQPLPPGVRIFPITSDEFFSGSASIEALGGAPIDLAFIDGMHHSDFALRDFINIERRCTPASTVLIHDCYPLNRITAEREQSTVFWSGDVWRTIVTLRRHRPDLRIQVVATPPTGLAVVRGLDPDSRMLADRYDAIAAEMLALDYAMLDKDKAGALGRFPNDWDQIAALLAA